MYIKNEVLLLICLWGYVSDFNKKKFLCYWFIYQKTNFINRNELDIYDIFVL